MMELLLPLLGFLIGTIASMIGVGGGVFIVPLLTLFYNFQADLAVGTSITTIIFTSIASTANYAGQNRIYFKTGLILAVTTVPGAYLGAYITEIMPKELLGLVFGVFLFVVAFRMIFQLGLSKQRKQDSSEIENRSIVGSESSLFGLRKKISVGVGLSFFGGLSSGLLGIGGGSLLVPIMVLVMNIPMHITVATSMFTMIFTSTSAAFRHHLADHINFEYALLLALGTIFGAQLGAFASRKVSARNLRRFFGAVLIVVSIRMIIKYAPNVLQL